MNSTIVFLSVIVALASASQTYHKKADNPARYRIPAQRRAGYKHGFGTYGGAAGAYGGVNAYGAGNAYVAGHTYGNGNAYVAGRTYGAGNAYVGGRTYGTGNSYGAHFNSGSYQYHGKYGNACNADGLYYRNAGSYVVCTKGQALVRPCAPGTENSGYNKYVYGNYYGYTDFCDVNLNDYGYALAHQPQRYNYQNIH